MMKKTGIAVTILLLLMAHFVTASVASAATDGNYYLTEVAAAWDGTDASRLKASGADYNYTYGDEASVTYTLPWAFSFKVKKGSGLNTVQIIFPLLS